MVLRCSKEIAVYRQGRDVLKSGAEGKAGQGHSGQPARHGPGVAGFCSSGGAGMRRQRWPGSDPKRSRQHSSSRSQPGLRGP